jgi:uncharacterized protein (TIGR03084 family)
VSASLSGLCEQLVTETETLDALVRPLRDAQWSTPTPAEGWTVRDQIVHLARTDELARLSVVAPDDFVRVRSEIARDRDAYLARQDDADRLRTAPDALAFLHRERFRLLATVRDRDPDMRVPWFGPDMTIASMITARIMETWAHGQDCFDALGVEHEPSATLHAVAFIGVRTFANSYRARGRAVPDTAVRVELIAPDGTTWVFGPDDAADVVRGPAQDFALVVTRRRHPADTALVAEGAVASEWLTIAQAYAGAAGPDRRPGQFSRAEEAS